MSALLRSKSLDDVLVRRALAAADPTTSQRVASIIGSIRSGGAEALLRIAAELGDPEPRSVSAEELDGIAAPVDADLRAVLARTVERVRRVAEAQLPPRLATIEQAGARTTLRCVPVSVAACYAPAGRHPLVSSVVMTLVPAAVAGVETRLLVSPRLTAEIAAAAVASGATGGLVLGGAQSVAACALGVSPAPRADVFVGPGNKYVAEAKRQLSGLIGVEGFAGPSEVLVVADGESNPDLVAADLLAQAEHDPDAEAILLLQDDADPEAFQRSLSRLADPLATRETIVESLAGQGAVIRWSSEADLLDAIDRLAPEHLALHLDDGFSRSLAARVRNAGAIFVGARSAEALGDYGAGPNHTLPTGGAARFQQGLSPSIYIRQRAELECADPDPRLIGDVEALARVEGLPAHGLAASLRRG